MKQYPVRLPPEIVARLERVGLEISRRPHLAALLADERGTMAPLLRMAIYEGLPVLEKELGIEPPAKVATAADRLFAKVKRLGELARARGEGSLASDTAWAALQGLLEGKVGSLEEEVDGLIARLQSSAEPMGLRRFYWLGGESTQGMDREAAREAQGHYWEGSDGSAHGPFDTEELARQDYDMGCRAQVARDEAIERSA